MTIVALAGCIRLKMMDETNLWKMGMLRMYRDNSSKTYGNCRIMEYEDVVLLFTFLRWLRMKVFKIVPGYSILRNILYYVVNSLDTYSSGRKFMVPSP